eukprot:365855-Chlamydomonas_euryale.AAC.8
MDSVRLQLGFCPVVQIERNQVAYGFWTIQAQALASLTSEVDLITTQNGDVPQQILLAHQVVQIGRNQRSLADCLKATGSAGCLALDCWRGCLACLAFNCRQTKCARSSQVATQIPSRATLRSLQIPFGIPFDIATSVAGKHIRRRHIPRGHAHPAPLHPSRASTSSVATSVADKHVSPKQRAALKPMPKAWNAAQGPSTAHTDMPLYFTSCTSPAVLHQLLHSVLPSLSLSLLL